MGAVEVVVDEAVRLGEVEVVLQLHGRVEDFEARVQARVVNGRFQDIVNLFFF
jgi:hypothetical protein